MTVRNEVNEMGINNDCLKCKAYKKIDEYEVLTETRYNETESLKKKVSKRNLIIKQLRDDKTTLIRMLKERAIKLGELKI